MKRNRRIRKRKHSNMYYVLEILKGVAAAIAITASALVISGIVAFTVCTLQTGCTV